MYVALVQFLYELMVEMDQFVCVDVFRFIIGADRNARWLILPPIWKRIREVKVEQPGITLNDILEHLFVYRGEDTWMC